MVQNSAASKLWSSGNLWICSLLLHMALLSYQLHYFM